MVSLVFALVLFLRLQGPQYWAAYGGGGFAKPLPAVAYPAAGAGRERACASGAFNVLSFNVMFGSELVEDLGLGDGLTGGHLPWSVRAPVIRERIAAYNPDLIGLQETHTDTDIALIVPLASYTLVNYRLGSLHYGDAALLFRTERFTLLDFGQLWLGPTPELPLALGFKPVSMVRYVNWALLEEKGSGFTFLFVNTHFDNAGDNKEPAATLFAERVSALARNLPIIAVGDFNTKASEERYVRLLGGGGHNPPLLNNAYDLAGGPAVAANLHPGQRIDHILVGGPCQAVVESWHIDTRPMDEGQPLSDHDPVRARLRFVAPAQARPAPAGGAGVRR